MASVNADRFVEFMIGAPEEPSQMCAPLCVVEFEGHDAEQVSVLKCARSGKSFVIGQFYQRCATDFGEDVDDGVEGTFTVRCGRGAYTRNVHMVDVGALQAAPSNNGATFQVASNFNCLEYTSGSSNASRYGISCYISDRTQGPAASISCAAGTLYRNYWLPHTDERGEEQHGQLHEQINLLSELRPGAGELVVPVQNGYVRLDGEAAAAFERAAPTVDDAYARFHSLVKVGVQLHTEVVYGARGAGGRLTVCSGGSGAGGGAQVVNQVFTAAVDLASNRRSAGIETCARFLLRSSYELTVRSAIEASRHPLNAKLTGRRRLYLTLVGGGVFANRKEWIVDAIERQEALIRRSGLQVVLICYNGLEIEAVRPRLQALAERLGGAIEDLE